MPKGVRCEILVPRYRGWQPVPDPPGEWRCLDVLSRTATAGGDQLAARYSHVTLIGPGIPEKVEPTDNAPAVFLEFIEIGDRTILRARPERAGSFGGCYVKPAGEIWSAIPYPIPLLDHYEKPMD